MALDEDEVDDLVLRGIALLCSAISAQGTRSENVIARARKFEDYLRGDDRW